MRFDLTDVPALTLQNPWAFAITADVPDPKRVENRSWPAPEAVDRFFIHAGKGNDADGYDILEQFGVDLPEHMPSSAIVALAQLAYVCNGAIRRNPAVCGCGRWAAPDQYHWLLGQVLVLPEPVPTPGRQKLWQPTPDVRAAAETQLRAAVVR